MDSRRGRPEEEFKDHVVALVRYLRLSKAGAGVP